MADLPSKAVFLESLKPQSEDDGGFKLLSTADERDSNTFSLPESTASKTLNDSTSNDNYSRAPTECTICCENLKTTLYHLLQAYFLSRVRLYWLQNENMCPTCRTKTYEQEEDSADEGEDDDEDYDEEEFDSDVEYDIDGDPINSEDDCMMEYSEIDWENCNFEEEYGIPRTDWSGRPTMWG